jgi:hypothetical protein
MLFFKHTSVLLLHRSFRFTFLLLSILLLTFLTFCITKLCEDQFQINNCCCAVLCCAVCDEYLVKNSCSCQNHHNGQLLVRSIKSSNPRIGIGISCNDKAACKERNPCPFEESRYVMSCHVHCRCLFFV